MQYNVVMNRENLKKKKEKIACDALFRDLKYNIEFIKFGNPEKREPDCVYSFRGRKIGCEVTDIWYNEEHAKIFHEIIEGKIVLNKDNPSVAYGGVWEPDKTMLVKIREAINKKNAKKYKGVDCYYLILREGMLITDSEEIKALSKNMDCGSKIFDRIFVLIKDLNVYKSIEVDAKKM